MNIINKLMYLERKYLNISIKITIFIISRNSITSAIEKLNPKPEYLEDILKKIKDVIIPEKEDSNQPNNNDKDDDNNDEKSKSILFILAKALQTMRKCYIEGAAQYHKEFDVYINADIIIIRIKKMNLSIILIKTNHSLLQKNC